MSLQITFESVKDVFCDIFGRRLRSGKIREIVQVGMIQRLQDLFHLLFQDSEIDHHPLLAQSIGRDRNFHFPVVAVQGFAFSVEAPQSVGS